jgi:uncharacterized protein DUF4038/collagenase-like protein with putative collagen-binding domain
MKKFLFLLLAWQLFNPELSGAETPYLVKVGPSRRDLVDQRGAPFLLQGDAGWSLISGLTKEEAEQYLENRRQKGFNTIMVNLIEHKFKGPANRYGDGPFLKPGDFSTPNEKYFEHADWVIRKAGEKGIQILLTPIYLGYKGTDEGWIEETLRNGTSKCLAYGRYVGRRYQASDNIIWLIGGDRNPEQALEAVNAVVTGMREFDHRHLMTAHCAPEYSATEVYGDGGWLDLNSTYTYQLIHPLLLRDYNRSPAIPFFLIESTYEGEHNASAVQIRRQAYWAILCGATGHIIGNRPIWLFDPGWQKAMEGPASKEMVYLKALFTSRSWHLLVPDQRHEVVTEGLGELRGLDTLIAARTSDGATIIAYMPTSRAITVGLSKLSGSRSKAWWFNPRTGTAETVGEFAAEGRKQFTPPGEGDWVFVIDDAARSLSAPGAR